jgi:hypothetical protein
MKTLKFAIILLAIVSSFSITPQVKAQQVSVNFSLFQNELGPHGRWMTNPRFGQVWIYNDPGFKPYYSDGHWEYTNYGWSWVSDFDWGWAPFHYGRWEYDPSFGWMWIPGYEWGAAWVSWSSYDDYYGWAPLGYGVNVNVSFGSIAYDRWTFIPRRNICDRDINRYYIAPGRNNGFRNAVVINNYYEGNGGGRFMRGPERREVERYTNNRIQERRIDDRERNGRYNANNNGRGQYADNGGIRNSVQQPGGNNTQQGNQNFPGRREAGPDNNNNNNAGVRNNRQQTTGNDGQRNPNFPGRREADVTDNNNRIERNNRQQRNIDPQRDANLPQRREAAPVDNNRQPNREVYNNPQQNQDRFPNRQNDNRGNRNEQPNNFPQQRQQVERPARQPMPEQRRAERSNDQNGGGQGMQQSNNNQPQPGNGNGRGRRG